MKRLLILAVFFFTLPLAAQPFGLYSPKPFGQLLASIAATNGNDVTIIIGGDSITDEAGAGKWLDYVIFMEYCRYNSLNMHFRDYAKSGQARFNGGPTGTFTNEFGGPSPQGYGASNDQLMHYDQLGAFWKADVVMDMMTINSGSMGSNDWYMATAYMVSNRFMLNGAMGTNASPGAKASTNYNGAAYVFLLGCNPQDQLDPSLGTGINGYGTLTSFQRSLAQVAVGTNYGVFAFDLFGFLRQPYSNNFASGGNVKDNANGADQYNLQWWTPHSGPAGQLTYAWAYESQVLNELTGTNIVASWSSIDAVSHVFNTTNCTVSAITGTSTSCQFTRSNSYESGYCFDGYGTIGNYTFDTANQNGHGIGSNLGGAIGMFPGIQTSNQVLMIVSSLSAGNYSVFEDGTNVGTYTASQLASGVNINTWTNGAIVDQMFNGLNQVRLMRGFYTTNDPSGGGFITSSGGTQFGNTKVRGQLLSFWNSGQRNDALVNNPTIIAFEMATRTNSAKSDKAIQAATKPLSHTFTILPFGGAPPAASTPLAINGSISMKGAIADH